MESRIHREVSVRLGGEKDYFSLAYGTKHQSAEPFVRPAIKNCESGIRVAMERIFNQKSRS